MLSARIRPRLVHLPLLPGLAGGLLWLILLFLWSPADGVEAFAGRRYSPYVTDRNGRLLQILPLEEGLRREYVPLEELPGELVQLLVQSEDRRFPYHFGVDPLAMFRAALLFAREGEIVSGGSTITMQLARIINPHEPTVTGKLKEMVQAVWLEFAFPKERILELWINNIPYGRNTEGVVSASREYFGHGPVFLTRGEAAVLAVLPRSPVYYNPALLDRRNGEAERGSALADRVLALLRETDMADGLTREDLLADIREGNRRGANYVFPRLVPHFIAMIRPQITEEEWHRGGRLITSLDLDRHGWMEDTINRLIDDARENRIHNGAALVLDNRTGEILAYVGSQDFSDTSQGQIDGIQAFGQPGSTMKPFLYALALDRGMTPATVLPDIPMMFGSREIYTPENFNNRFNGPVRLRTALASSLNIPAVYVLEKLGTPLFIEKLKEAGFSSLEGREGELGTGVALGDGDVTLWELTSAFALFPRGGETLTPRWRKDESYQEGRQIYSERSAALINDILTDRTGRVTGFGQSSRLDTDFPAIFKTGTSNQFNDIWALGATTDLTCGVWMGNFSGETVIGRPGSSLPAEGAAGFLREFSAGHEFPPPEGVKQVRICTLSGEAAGLWCPGTMEELIPEEISLDTCSFHGPDGEIRWPDEYRYWREGSRSSYSSSALHEPEGRLVLLHPPSGSQFYLDENLPGNAQSVRIEASAPEPITLYVDGRLLAEKSPSPLRISRKLERGTHQILLITDKDRAEGSYDVK